LNNSGLEGSSEADTWRPTAIVPRVPTPGLKRRLRALINRGREFIPSIEAAAKSCREQEEASQSASLARFANWELADGIAWSVTKWISSCERVLRPALHEQDFARISFRKVEKAELLKLGIEASAELLRVAVTRAVDTLEAVYEALPGRLTTVNGHQNSPPVAMRIPHCRPVGEGSVWLLLCG